MKYRPHKRSLEDSMAQCVDIEPTKAAVADRFNASIVSGPAVEAKNITCRHYVFDDRINWETYIITEPNWGVLGFSNGPIE